MNEDSTSNGATDIDCTKTTDVIISGYENKINQNIAYKSLIATKNGKVPTFTEEELLYLNKHSNMKRENDELEIITPIKDIVLKKGKTEINIDKAVKIVKKMEALYPKESLTTHDIVKEIVSEYEKPKQTETELPEEKRSVTTGEIVKTVNKNAYEIRLEILKSALDFSRWLAEMKMTSNTAVPNNIATILPTEDSVFELASKFYKFVENKR